jgi:hypothetical protein
MGRVMSGDSWVGSADFKRSQLRRRLKTNDATQRGYRYSLFA